MAPGLPPFTFDLLPRGRLEAGWGLAEVLLSLWPPLGGRRLWRFKNRGAQAPGFILTPAKICLAFLKNNHNSWVKNQFATRLQPQAEPPQGEVRVPDRVLQPHPCCFLNPLGPLTQIGPTSPGYLLPNVG